MLKTLKKFTTFVLSISLILSLSTPAFAGKARDMGFLPSKTSKDLGNLQYEVRLKVPGVDGSATHDEVIIMVDASYSGDRYWNDMKNNIYAIGEAVLNGNGNTQLSIMSFAMCGHTVLSHVRSMDELKKALDGSEPGCLLYGLSSTNCEVGFTWINDYINNHDSSLNNAYVMYITDGGANTHEEPFVYSDWENRTWTTFTDEFILKNAFMEEAGAIHSGANPSPAFKAVFGETFDIEKVVNEATVEQQKTLLNNIWADVYASKGLTLGAAYPVSVLERAFLDYDNANGTYIQWSFYYVAYGRRFTDAGTRATVAGNRLMNNAKLAKLYMVDTNTINEWISNMSGPKLSILQSNGISGMKDAISEILKTMGTTPYNDVVITDYMSKWVNLDASTLKITDTKEDKVIWTSAEGWLINEGRPTAAENPVEIEKVAAENYSLGGAEVEGNTSGDIYKLTWHVKDGAMLRSDNYQLTYTVNVDTEESGFKWDTDYPANGTTTVDYKDEDNNPQNEDISVPDVEADMKWWKYKLTVNYIDENGNPLRTPFTDEMTAGAEYKVDSPAVKGYLPINLWYPEICLLKTQLLMLYTNLGTP